MKDKYKISLLSVAMATIVLVAMAATAGVTAAQTVTVNPNGQVSVVYAASNEYIFAQSTAGKLVYENASNPTWINVLGTVGSAPSAILQPSTANPNQVTVFARGTDGNLYSSTTTDITAATTSGAWSAATKLSGTVAAGTGPVAVYNPSTPQTDVFFVDSVTHQLMEDSSTTSGIFPPSAGSTPLGGYVTATPGAVVTGTGGYVIGTPAGVAPSASTGIDVFARGNPNGLYEKIYATGGWGGWTHFNNGALAAGTGPTVISEGLPPTDIGQTAAPYGGAVAVFVTGTNFRLYEAIGGPNGLTWQSVYDVTGHGSRTLVGWHNLGGVLTSSPSAVWDGANVVLARGGDNNIWTNVNGYWNAPPPIAAP
jgi:hypothetical protein